MADRYTNYAGMGGYGTGVGNVSNELIKPIVPIQPIQGMGQVVSPTYAPGTTGGVAASAANLQTLPQAGGLGNYANLISPDGTTTALSKEAYDSMYGNTDMAGYSMNKTPGGLGSVQGLPEKSMFDKTISGIGAATQVGGLGANIYFANENLKAQKDFTNWQKDRVAASDRRKQEFARRAGGSYIV
jgi:hypothetical protein